MKHNISQSIVVGLELTQDEESIDDREMRQKFFTATSIAPNRTSIGDK